jgi:deoxyribose-phosphate aldolase
MCLAVRDFFDATGRRVGIKAAGGLKTSGDAIRYYAIAREVLGEAWLTPEFFRLGASDLANSLLLAIENKEVFYY